jgi:FkbM family methyltransferase
MPDDPRQEERARLQALPRYQRTTTTLMGEPFEILDAESFLVMYEEIVEDGMYFFQARDEYPYIVDGGANVGVSVVYFKRSYPNARIVAFEPDPEAFALLERNVKRRGYTGVRLAPQALAADAGMAPFVAEGSYAGRLARAGEAARSGVPTARLRPCLEERVDLLKLNIEGAETEVLTDCADLLANVDRIVVEYHSFAAEPQRLDVLMQTLTKAEFRLYVRSVSPNWPRQPFAGVPVHLGMDLQLWIYGYRTGDREI